MYTECLRGGSVMAELQLLCCWRYNSGLVLLLLGFKISTVHTALDPLFFLTIPSVFRIYQDIKNCDFVWPNHCIIIEKNEEIYTWFSAVNYWYHMYYLLDGWINPFSTKVWDFFLETRQCFCMFCSLFPDPLPIPSFPLSILVNFEAMIIF